MAESLASLLSFVHPLHFPTPVSLNLNSLSIQVNVKLLNCTSSCISVSTCTARCSALCVLGEGGRRGLEGRIEKNFERGREEAKDI